jgi:hypothetical protein
MDGRSSPAMTIENDQDFSQKFCTPCRVASPPFVYWARTLILGEQAMSTYALCEPGSIRMFFLGRLLGGLVILFLLLDGVNRLVPWPVVTEALDRLGYGSSDALARALGTISVAGMALTTIPPTSIVGAILWTGYLGNLVVTHFPIV